MKRGAVLTCAVVCLLAGSLPAGAGALRKWGVDVSVHGGFNKLDADSDIKESGVVGARLGLAVFPSFIVEGSFESTSSESERQALPDSDYSEDSYGLRAIGVFRAAEDVRVQPYVVAGGGITDVQFDPGLPGRAVEEDETQFQEVGAGARVGILKDLAVRGEVVVKHFRANHVTQSDIHFTVGISYFLFGKK
jgi:hypothetical protein